MSPKASDEFLTVDQAAALLEVDRSTVRRWIGRGKLPAYRVGERYVRLRKSDLDRVVTPIAKPPIRHPVASGPVAVSSLLTAEEKCEALDIARRARELRHELRDRWGATQRDLLAYELINLAREERSWQLS